MTAVPQHMAALQGANRVRFGRAALHREIGALPRPAGCLRVAELLEEPSPVIATMRVADLLVWIHRIGNSQARSILRHADTLGPISEFRQIGQLSERQRIALVDHLYLAYRAARQIGGIPR